jgi:transcriptional regulator with XRE-family HTH domain
MSNIELFENGKIAVALRTGRTAIGWSQLEFAEKLGVAKSTIARIETLEMSPKADLVTRAMRLFREAGLEMDLYQPSDLSVNISGSAILEAIARLKDDTKRRSDRSGIKGLVPPDPTA